MFPFKEEATEATSLTLQLLGGKGRGGPQCISFESLNCVDSSKPSLQPSRLNSLTQVSHFLVSVEAEPCLDLVLSLCVPKSWEFTKARFYIFLLREGGLPIDLSFEE